MVAVKREVPWVESEDGSSRRQKESLNIININELRYDWNILVSAVIVDPVVAAMSLAWNGSILPRRRRRKEGQNYLRVRLT
jgi:hypothetical protein